MAHLGSENTVVLKSSWFNKPGKEKGRIHLTPASYLRVYVTRSRVTMENPHPTSSTHYEICSPNQPPLRVPSGFSRQKLIEVTGLPVRRDYWYTRLLDDAFSHICSYVVSRVYCMSRNPCLPICWFHDRTALPMPRLPRIDGHPIGVWKRRGLQRLSEYCQRLRRVISAIGGRRYVPEITLLSIFCQGTLIISSNSIQFGWDAYGSA